MCGIVGTIGYKNRSLLEDMNEMQFHRGPDSAGVYWNCNSNVGLAMRRLSIVDLENGSQPMFNEDGSVVVVFNGEIFNAPELREKLVKKGHTFKTTNSDTEVIVHLYEEYKNDMFGILNGMFAIALYDLNAEKLLLARDHVGIKPLFYEVNDGKVRFASELKSIVKTNNFKSAIDNEALSHYLSIQFIPAPLTIYSKVKKLEAGESIVIDVNTLEIEHFKYWDINRYTNNKAINDYDEAVNIVKKEVSEAIKRWEMSDVPVACLLSGGLDSSILTSVISKSNEVEAYTLGFSAAEDIDERKLAELVASRNNVNINEIILEAEDLLQELPEMVEALDEPYGGGIPSWFVYKELGAKYKVAITGVGGDELFGNYGKWKRYESLEERLYYVKNFVFSGGGIRELILYPHGSIYHMYMSDRLKRKFLQKTKFNKNSNTARMYHEQLKGIKDKSYRNKIVGIDFRMQLPEEFLMMTDRFSMAHSVEARTPFLDRKLIEKVMSINPKLRTNEISYKKLIMDACGDLLPEELLRAKKKGFVIPYKEWLRGELRNQMENFMSKEYLEEQGIFNYKISEKLWNSFCYKENDRYTAFVWTVFMFQLWYENNRIYIV